jgi:hypothetical protein
MSRVVASALPYLTDYCKIKNKKKKADFIRVLGDRLLEAVTEIAINTLAENVPLSSSQKRKLFTYRQDIRKLASPKAAKCCKKKILVQRGGSFLPILLPIITSIVSSLIGHG